MVEFVRGLWRLSCPTALLKKGHQEQVAQNHALDQVIWLLNISKEGDTTVSVDNLFQCSVTLTVKKCFLMFR